MKKSFVSALILMFSLSAAALAPIKGNDALDIVKTLDKMGLKPVTAEDVAGYTNIKTYSLMGLVCQTGLPTNAFNPQVEATCSLEIVLSVGQLKQIKAILQSGGLNSNNAIFKL